jgi:hypothetical protein
VLAVEWALRETCQRVEYSDIFDAASRVIATSAFSERDAGTTWAVRFARYLCTIVMPRTTRKRSGTQTSTKRSKRIRTTLAVPERSLKADGTFYGEGEPRPSLPKRLGTRSYRIAISRTLNHRFRGFHSVGQWGRTHRQSVTTHRRKSTRPDLRLYNFAADRSR